MEHASFTLMAGVFLLFVEVAAPVRPPPFMKDANGDGHLRMCFVGDSLSVLDPARGWFGSPYIVQSMMEGAHPEWEVFNDAIPGATITRSKDWWDFQDLWRWRSQWHECDLYILEGGTNDAGQKRDPKEVINTILGLIESIAARPGAPATIVALTPNFSPPNSKKYFWANEYAAAYNALIGKYVQEDRVIDLRSITLASGDHTPEGTHFNLRGQCKRAAAVYGKLFPGEALPDTLCCHWKAGLLHSTECPLGS